jgi:hypothetical protein
VIVDLLMPRRGLTGNIFKLLISWGCIYGLFRLLRLGFDASESTVRVLSKVDTWRMGYSLLGSRLHEGS